MNNQLNQESVLSFGLTAVIVATAVIILSLLLLIASLTLTGFSLN